MKALTLLFILLLLVGCSSKPTKIYRHRKETLTGKLEGGLKAPIVIGEDTIVIDARSTFEYTIAHLPKSFQISSDEFLDRRSKIEGRVKKSLFRLARRLARKGIDPDSKVVVVGDGKSFEAGQVSWGLFYIGIQDVQFVSMNYFGKRYSNSEAKPYKAKKMWKPKYNRSVLVSKLEVVDAISKGVGNRDSNGDRLFILDVRSEKEYLNKVSLSHGFQNLNVDAVHIPSSEFFDRSGRPKLAIKKRLKAIGVTTNDRLIVISNKGHRSSGVTMSLLSLGFSKSGNYSDGYQGLMAK